MWNAFNGENSSWFTFDFANPTEQHMAETILRFATAADPGLFSLAGVEVSVMSITSVPGLELVCLTSGGEEYYGIFEQQRKFHVFDDLTINRLFPIYFTETEAHRLEQALVESFKSYRESNPVVQSSADLRVNDQYLPTAHWEFYDATVPDYQDTIGHLQTNYPNYFPKSAQFLPFWTAPLTFSARYELLEVRYYDKGRHFRFFLLIDYNEDKSGEMNSQLIDGSSASLHNIWFKAAQDETVYFSLETDEQLKEYLSVFCWGITGDNGHFILPRHYVDFPWTDHDKAAWESLRPKVDESWTVVRNADNVQIRNVVVAYGSSVFEAAFEITLDQGEVTMVDDVTLYENLPLEPAPLVPSVQRPQHSEPNPSVEAQPVMPPPELPDRSILARLAQHEGRTKITEDEFQQALKTGVLRDSIIDFEIRFDPDVINKKNVELINCSFENRFSIVRGNAACSITFSLCEFFVGFSAHDICCNGSFMFNDCVFMGYVDQSQLRTGTVADFQNFTCTGSLFFSDCFFWGLASMSNMRISGDVKINGCYFSTLPFLMRVYGTGIVTSNEHQPTADTDFSEFSKIVSERYNYFVLIMDNSRIEGNLTIEESTRYEGLWSNFYGHVKADGISISGKATIRQTFVAAGIDFCNARFGQDVNFTRPDYHLFVQTEFVVGSLLDMTNARVEGAVNLAFANVHTLWFYGTEVDTNITLLGVKSDTIDLRFAKVSGMVWAYYNFPGVGRRALAVTKSIEFDAAQINAVRLEGIYVGEDIVFKSGNFNGIKIAYGVVLDGSPTLVHSEIMGQVSMRNVVIREDLNLAGIRIAHDSYTTKRADQGFVLNNCQIGGDLMFFDKQAFRTITEEIQDMAGLGHLYEEYHHFPAEVNGKLEIRANDIGGNLDLRNIRVRTKSVSVVKIPGWVLLDDCKVGLDMKISGYSRYFDGIKNGVLRIGTTCSGISMKGIEIRGDANITGLTVDSKGGLDGVGMTIGGGLFLIADKNYGHSIGSDKDIGPLATISGVFDISLSEIKDVYFTKKNFPADVNVANSPLNLERTTIKKLRIVEPAPNEVYLSGMKVTEWDFGPRSESGKAKNYLKILAEEKGFNQNVYLDIERDLRNANHSQAADRIYIRMRHKSIRNNISTSYKGLRKAIEKRSVSGVLSKLALFLGSLVGGVFGMIQYILTGYGTTFIRLLVLWAALLILMTSVSYQYRGQILSDAVSGQSGSQVIFNRDDAFIYAAQNAVPFFELKLIDANPETTRLRYWFLGAKVAAYVLLSFAIVGYSANIARGKQG